MSIKKGIQMWSAHTLAERDLPGTIRKMAGLGYDGIEFAGYYDHPAAELKKALDDCGVVCCGSHIGLQIMQNDLQKTIDFSLELGCPYMIVPWLSEQYRTTADDWKRSGEMFNEFGAKIKKAGMTFAYHNHYYGLDMFDGVMGLDLLFSNTDPALVKMQVDVGNIEMRGTVKAVDFMRRYASACELVHVKDYPAPDTYKSCVIGEGAADFPAVITLGKELGVTWYTVEYEVEDDGDALVANIGRCLEGLRRAEKTSS
ncbi:MAG: sugar phosphate isomerase/epimerase [Clostridia bacterium]|nr:sugar phosphate isomerase/epimerase [Clostridia bacterium]